MKYKLSFSDFKNPLPYSFVMRDIGGFSVPFYLPLSSDNVPTSAKNGIIPILSSFTYEGSLDEYLMGFLPFFNEPYIPHFVLFDGVIFGCSFPSLNPDFRYDEGLTDFTNLSLYSLFSSYVGKFCVVSFDNGTIIHGAFDNISDAMLLCCSLISSLNILSRGFYLRYVLSAHIESSDSEEVFYYLRYADSAFSVSPIISLSCCPLDYSPLIKLLGGQ